MIERNNMYKISREKFEFDIDSIIKLEKSWIGHEVLSYNHFTNKYEWGIITRRILNSRQFELEWPDRKRSIHCAYFLFISKNKNFDSLSKKFIDFEVNESNSAENKYNFVANTNTEFYRHNNLRRAKSYFNIDKDRETPIIDASELGTFSYLD